MAPIKCIGCLELRREELYLSAGSLVAYNCPRYFPYMCALSGLIHPGKGILEAIKDCPDDPLEHCILCSITTCTHFGVPSLVSICKEHGIAWGEWLDKHPERRHHFAPRNRGIRAKWIEVFREFIEDMRSKQ